MEQIIVLALAGCAGFGWTINRTSSAVSDLHKRLDSFELRAAEKYMTRDDTIRMFGKVEDWMIRIEDKIDNLSR